MSGARAMRWIAGAALGVGIAGLVAHGGGDPLTARRALAQDLDINAIFSCEGPRSGGLSAADCATTRGAVLQNCTSCHTFVPIVKAQKTPDEWDSTLGVHRERVPDVADGQYKQIAAFLAANFNPANTPPTLPPELEALGTQQAN